MTARTFFLGLGLLTISPQLSTVLAQGNLSPPPGTPAPTMKTLGQIEPRTPISSLPVTLNSSGSYYLTKNLSVSSGNGITITGSGITVDLNGFTISSTSPNPNGTAIMFTGALNVTVKNGFIESGVTLTGGTFSGTGFVNGMYYSLSTPRNVLISHVSVAGVLGDGIDLGTSESSVVESCTVRLAGGAGIIAWQVRDSAVRGCGNVGIYGGEIENSSAGTTSSFTGIQADNAQNCSGFSSGSGTGMDVSTAQNCRASSQSGVGLNANTAMNCYGSSDSNDGIQIAQIATNCFGSSNTGRGIVTSGNANTCYGITTSGAVGLNATVATACEGNNGAPGSVGLTALTGISCAGSPNQFILNKYDMVGGGP